MSDSSEPAAAGASVSTLPAPEPQIELPSVPPAVAVEPAPSVPTPRKGFRGRLHRVGWYLTRPLVFLRYLLRKTIWVIVKVIRAGWRRPIIALLLIILLGVGYQGYNEYVKEESPPPAREVYDIAAAIPPAQVVEDYLAAQRELDGSAIWDMLAESVKTSLLSQGITKETYQQQFDDLRTNGLSFGDSTYVGGVEGSDGVNFYYYLTRLVSVSGQAADIYEVFLVEEETGKILQVDTPLMGGQ